MIADTTAIVLKRTKMQEGDAMITLFSENLGIIKAVAGNARHHKSQISSSTQPFTVGRFIISMGSRYNRISSAEIIESNYGLSSSVMKISLASYFSECLSRTLREGDTSREIFNMVRSALSILADDDANAPLVKVAFEIKLLKLSGFEIMLSSCSKCGYKGQMNHFSPKDGGMVCPECDKTVARSYKIGSTLPRLISFISSAGMDQIVRTDISEMYVLKLQTLIREYMESHIDMACMKSLKIYEELK
jgi:DNA repair protein RecO (recombination protein O)